MVIRTNATGTRPGNAPCTLPNRHSILRVLDSCALRGTDLMCHLRTLNKNGILLPSMPMPVSVILTTTHGCPASHTVSTRTHTPPLSVYLMAFPIKLMRTWKEMATTIQQSRNVRVMVCMKI